MAINIDEAGLDAFLADPSTPGGDLNPTGTAAPAAPAAPVSEASTPVEIPEAPAAEAELPAGDTFPREYVEKLRRENATYRDRSKKYNEVFEGYEPEAIEEWLSLATTLKENPAAAADRFGELAEAIRNQYADPNSAAADAAVAEAGLEGVEAAAEEDRPLTRKELDAIFAEREQKAELQRRVAQIELDATGLGYEKGSDQYDELLFIASRLPNGSIQDAHARMEAKKQAVIDAYIAQLNGAPAPKVPGNGAPQSGETSYKTFEEANSALDAWLANQS